TVPSCAFLFFYQHGPPRDLPSFPTRRSSDLGTTCFALFRGTVRAILHVLRGRGWNSRTAAIIGTGRSAQRLLHSLRYQSWIGMRSEEHTSELQSRENLVCRLLLEKKKKTYRQ